MSGTQFDFELSLTSAGPVARADPLRPPVAACFFSGAFYKAFLFSVMMKLNFDFSFSSCPFHGQGALRRPLVLFRAVTSLVFVFHPPSVFFSVASAFDCHLEPPLMQAFHCQVCAIPLQSDRFNPILFYAIMFIKSPMPGLFLLPFLFGRIPV